MTNVTCRLTAKKPGSGPCPTLVILYGTTLHNLIPLLTDINLPSVIAQQTICCMRMKESRCLCDRGVGSITNDHHVLCNILCNRCLKQSFQAANPSENSRRVCFYCICCVTAAVKESSCTVQLQCPGSWRTATHQGWQSRLLCRPWLHVK